jgi:acetate kinase
MKHTEPERITQELLNELHHIIQYDMDHLPAEIELIEALRQRYPELPQVACFDTAFHSTMLRVAGSSTPREGVRPRKRYFCGMRRILCPSEPKA